MRRRWLWWAVGLVALAWLVPAAFVAFYDPGAPGLPAEAERALGTEGSRFFLLADGYEQTWSVETSQQTAGGSLQRSVATFRAKRGALDRSAGTFPFVLAVTLDDAEDLEALRLHVTSGGAWTRVDETVVAPRGAAHASLVLRASVPAATTAYRVEEVRGGRASEWFSKTMLRAPTFFGRAYDAIAWRGAWSWVPRLR
jgi:hypothetical protein